MKKTLLMATLLLIGFISQAATITVINTNDSGPGSLRQASIDAVSGDTIRFSPSLLTSGSDSISLSTEIDFGSKVVVIKGLYTPSDTLFISGGGDSRIFHFAANGEVYLDSLVLMNGNGFGVSLNGNGGAILFSALDDTVYIKNSVISNNDASSSGGGLFCYGTKPGLCLDNVTLSNNSAFGNGGGLYMAPNQVSENHLIVNNTTVSGNTANRGAGIYTLAEITLVTMTRSTVVHNTALSATGGIDITAGTTGDLTLENSTVAYNTAPTTAGIYIIGAWNPVLRPRNSIVIENGTGQSGIGGNLSLVSGGYNIYSDNLNTVPFSQNTVTDSLGQSAASVNLSSLAFHGGTTKTMKPLAGSIAIDAGDPADASAAQNGLISGVRDRGAAESCTATVSSFSATACSSYTVPSGDSTYTTTGTYTVNDTIPNAQGCDSLLTIALTIQAPTDSSFSVSECTAYTVPSGNTTYTTAGTYTVNDTIPNAQGCDSLLTIALTIQGQVDTSTTTTGFTITSNATGVSYQWIDCGNNNAPIVGDTNASYTATANGDYAVVVTDGNCSDTSACVSIIGVGVEDHGNISNAVSIYPNPAFNALTINTDNLNINSLSIVSLTGQTVKIETTTTKTMDVSDLPSGVYFLQVQTDKGMVNKRFIKR